MAWHGVLVSPLGLNYQKCACFAGGDISAESVEYGLLCYFGFLLMLSTIVFKNQACKNHGLISRDLTALASVWGFISRT